MSTDPISSVLLLSFDQSQSEDVQKVKGVLQEEQDIEVINFVDISHKFKKQPSYAAKLKLMLDRVKLAILITPNDVNILKDEQKIVAAIKLVYKISLDDEASKVFQEFLQIESSPSINNSKLLFFSFGVGVHLPEVFGNAEHLQSIFVKGDGDAEGTPLNVNRSQVMQVHGKCKRPGRITFPEANETVSEKKKCTLM